MNFSQYPRRPKASKLGLSIFWSEFRHRTSGFSWKDNSVAFPCSVQVPIWEITIWNFFSPFFRLFNISFFTAIPNTSYFGSKYCDFSLC